MFIDNIFAWCEARASRFRQRLQALLGLAEGRRSAEIARRLRVSQATIYYWLKRYRRAYRIQDLELPGDRDFQSEDRLRLSEALEKISTCAGRNLASERSYPML